ERQRRHEEQPAEHHRRTRHDVGCAATAEHGLRGAAERTAREAAALAGLNEHDTDEREADDEMEEQQESVHERVLRGSFGCGFAGRCAALASSEAADQATNAPKR